ncbi:hypothetical protein [Piscinibacter sp.]|uniref:hypothetical protein n=1 Tax=Piscinibacter sp. TaxID=1903157 RepID=UPI002B98FE9B|nr:hypothetical protein [Albitalea sp.]HUG24895.1 hypothetical protein [Albitalea sp.]
MNHPHSRPALAATFAAVAALMAGCGGGGSDAPPPPPPPPAAQTVTIAGVAADGPLQGATACYDLNDNAACDGDEPTSGATGADGVFSFEVDESVAGQHRVVVVVPADAIDADTGESVGVAFTMHSPATGTTGAHEVFVSPLTTLVQARIDATGASLADAVAFIQAQAALAISPLDDFTQSTDEGAAHAAAVARLLILTQQQQAAALAAVVGDEDVAGETITQADIDALLMETALESLPTLSAMAADPAVANAAPADLQQALEAAADTFIAQSAVTAQSAPLLIGVPKLPAADEPAEPEAGASLRALSYTDADNWFYRALASTEQDNTPDGDGLMRYYDIRSQNVAGTVTTWGFGNSAPRANDPHWNGSAWVACPLGTRSTVGTRDAEGRADYDYCDGYEQGVSVRTGANVSGRSIRTVIEEMVRTFPGSDAGVAFANWGPVNLDLLGSASFPADSTLWFYTNHAATGGPAYDVQDSGIVSAYPAAVASGGDARSTSGLACAGDLTGLYTPVATLEDLAARNPGSPCIFGMNTNADGSSLAQNEWWSNGTIHMGNVADINTLPAGTGNYYTTHAILRIGFAASGNGTTYYRCLQRRDNGSSRNCSVLGTGSYVIETLGDARVMSFTGLPALAESAGFTRVFVERDGQVRYGYKSPVPLVRKTLGFNLAAANAIFAQLGLPAIVPAPSGD